MSSQHNLSMAEEMGQEAYEHHMLHLFQKRRNLRCPGAAAVFGPSQSNPHKIPQAAPKPTKQNSPAAIVKPAAKQRDNRKRSQMRPRSSAFERACMPQPHRSVERPLKQGEDDDGFPDFSKEITVNEAAAVCGLYSSLVCSNRLDDKYVQLAQNSTELAMFTSVSTELNTNQSLSEQPSSSAWRAGISMDESKNLSQFVPPGWAAFSSRENPWHRPRNFRPPPMDVAVVALLEGQPPPTNASPEQALAARQALRLPAVRKAREVPRWSDSTAKSSPRKPPERPYWLRAGRKLTSGCK